MAKVSPKKRKIAKSELEKKLPRLRREPEDAKALILQSAEDLISERGPDSVGLKLVALRAGVSHSLVSHYFGTYDALVVAVLGKVVTGVRGRLMGAMVGAATAPAGKALYGVLEAFDAAFRDETQLKLLAWGLLSGRIEIKDIFSEEDKSLLRVVDSLENKMSQSESSKEDTSFLLMIGILSTIGFASGGYRLSKTLGLPESTRESSVFLSQLTKLLEKKVDR